MMTEDEMVGWHHRLNGHGFEQNQRDSGGWEAWPAALLGVLGTWTRLSD